MTIRGRDWYKKWSNTFAATSVRMHNILMCYFVLLGVASLVQSRRIIRAAPHASTTGCYMIKLIDETSRERFDDLVEHIREVSMDKRIYGKIDSNMIKVITAKLSPTELEEVS